MSISLTCGRCSSTFEFTQAEQEFNAGRGDNTTPTYCPRCRFIQTQGLTTHPQTGIRAAKFRPSPPVSALGTIGLIIDWTPSNEPWGHRSICTASINSNSPNISFGHIQVGNGGNKSGNASSSVAAK